MRILYDHQIFFAQRYGGVSRYFHELANGLAGLPGNRVEIFAPLHINDYFRAGDAVRPRGLRLPSLRRVHGLAAWINREASRRLLPRRRDVDIFHETYYPPDDNRPSSARRVVTLHDMIHERLPQHFPGDVARRAREAKALALRRADHVICVSETTRRDAMDLLGLPAERLSVVQHGCSLPADPASGNAHAPPAGPYLLYVGLRGGYKNFDALLQAYASRSELHQGFRLACFGGGAFSTQELARQRQLGLGGDRVLQFPGDDRQLAALYRGASALACPSLYEGFGMPPLEAMALGCPVACSDAGSLPEVVGDAAERFDPGDIGDMANALLRLVSDPALAADRVEQGRRRAALFSWDRCARETLAVYEKVLQA